MLSSSGKALSAPTGDGTSLSQGEPHLVSLLPEVRSLLHAAGQTLYILTTASAGKGQLTSGETTCSFTVLKPMTRPTTQQLPNLKFTLAGDSRP